MLDARVGFFRLKINYIPLANWVRSMVLIKRGRFYRSVGGLGMMMEKITNVSKKKITQTHSTRAY